MYNLRIVPADPKFTERHIKHFNMSIALEAARDYFSFSDVVIVEVTNAETGEIIRRLEK